MKTYKEIIDEKLEEAERVMNTFPRGAMNLPTEETRLNPVYRKAKQDFALWFNELRKYNKQFLKTHKRVGFEVVNGKRVPIYEKRA